MGRSSHTIGILTPTRGDRPLFVDQYNEIIKSQTLQPDEIIMVDYPPVSDKKDLGARYRIGIQEASKRGCNNIYFFGKMKIGIVFIKVLPLCFRMDVYQVFYNMIIISFRS